MSRSLGFTVDRTASRVIRGLWLNTLTPISGAATVTPILDASVDILSPLEEKERIALEKLMNMVAYQPRATKEDIKRFQQKTAIKFPDDRRNTHQFAL